MIYIATLVISVTYTIGGREFKKDRPVIVQKYMAKCLIRKGFSIQILDPSDKLRLEEIMSARPASPPTGVISVSDLGTAVNETWKRKNQNAVKEG